MDTAEFERTAGSFALAAWVAMLLRHTAGLPYTQAEAILYAYGNCECGWTTATHKLTDCGRSWPMAARA